MLAASASPSLDALIDQTIPPGIRSSTRRSTCRRRDASTSTCGGCAAIAATKHGRPVVHRHGLLRHHHAERDPAQRLREPGWYTPYTPYQAEIAQGRLESLLNFQTMVRDLTAMDIATASLLDEATAAAEAMTMLHRVQAEEGAGGRRRACSWCRSAASRRRSTCCRRAPSRSASRSWSATPTSLPIGPSAFGLLLQYPDDRGASPRPAAVIARAHAAGVLVAVATDLLALTLLTPPGEMGADVVVGNSQRFGVPLGYGGPHAAFFATREAFVRQAPGRIIGVSVDAQRPARRIAWRSRRASSTSAARRRRRTSAPRRRCWPTSRRCMPCITARRGCARLPTRVHGAGARGRWRADVARLPQTNAAYFDTLRVEGADAGGAVRRRGRGARASTSATSTTARSASRSTRRRPRATCSDIVDVFADGGREAGADAQDASRRSR